MKVEVIDLADMRKPATRRKWADLVENLQPGQAKKLTFEDGEDIEICRGSIRTAARHKNLKIGTMATGNILFIFLK